MYSTVHHSQRLSSAAYQIELLCRETVPVDTETSPSSCTVSVPLVTTSHGQPARRCSTVEQTALHGYSATGLHSTTVQHRGTNSPARSQHHCVALNDGAAHTSGLTGLRNLSQTNDFITSANRHGQLDSSRPQQ